MLSLDHIAWSLPDGDPILKDISLNIAPGKLTVVTGPNGGGKTSLAKLIAGLEMPEKGSIRLLGNQLHSLRLQRAVRD